MAIGPTLPPQAYTREVLTSAFNWLQTQPDSVRKLATTPDALVGLFMRAQRYGASSLENDAPVSSQNFMSDLKNLAEGLKQFESPQLAQALAQPTNPQMNHQPVMPRFTPPPVMTTAQPPAPMPAAAPVAAEGALTERTQAMIQEVKAHLNLSCDAEAINLMVALAYKNLKSLLA